MKFSLSCAVSLGGVIYHAAEHEAKIVKDWFFHALVSDGALTVLEDDEEVIEEEAPKGGRKPKEETPAEVIEEVAVETPIEVPTA